MAENEEMVLLCKEKVEGFTGAMRDCNNSLFEVIMVDRETIKLKCGKCGNAKSFRVVECLDDP